MKSLIEAMTLEVALALAGVGACVVVWLVL